jgi:DNA/RNA-binding domain of Phe-tRNA-synthetase-like protein
LSLRISQAVRDRHPNYKALVLYVDSLQNGGASAYTAEIAAAATLEARARFAEEPVAKHPHVVAWRAAYQSFGSKPSRYPCSAEALLRRVVKGQDLPQINAVVDIYNATSIRRVLPIGGEDRSCVRGDVVLQFASGQQSFAGLDGEIEHPPEGEIVWADDDGVTCRRWNWRQCGRTQLTELTTSAYFLLEALPPFGWDELEPAGEELAGHLRRISLGCQIVVEELGSR